MKSKQGGKRKPLWYLCFPALKNLHPHPQAARCMHRWMAAWPNSMVLCKAKTLPTPRPKIPHWVPSKANFQWQAIRAQATKALARLGTGCSSWLFQDCLGCQHGASRGNWCHPDLCWQTPNTHPCCPNSSLPLGHGKAVMVNSMAVRSSPAFHPSCEKWGTEMRTSAAAAHSSGCSSGQTGAFLWGDRGGFICSAVKQDTSILDIPLQ